MARKLVLDAKSSRGEMWRGEHLNGVRFRYPPDVLLAGTQTTPLWPLPPTGLLELDLIALDCPEQARSLSFSRPNTFVALHFSPSLHRPGRNLGG